MIGRQCRRRYLMMKGGYASDSALVEVPKCLKTDESPGLMRKGKGMPELLEELRMHFDVSARLSRLRDSLAREMRRRDIGIGDMFALVDTDGSLSIEADEMMAMARQLNIELRQADASTLIQEIGGGEREVTIERFTFWYNDETRPVCMDRALLALDSTLTSREVRALIDEWWALADCDGSGCLQHDEYIALSTHLQRALGGSVSEAVAEQDWDEDRRGANVVDRRRFELSMLQLARAWDDESSRDASQAAAAAERARRGQTHGDDEHEPAALAASVARTLCRLLDLVSCRDGHCRVWRWNLNAQLSRESFGRGKEHFSPSSDDGDGSRNDITMVEVSVLPQSSSGGISECSGEASACKSAATSSSQASFIRYSLPQVTRVEMPRVQTPPPSPRSLEQAIMPSLRPHKSPHNAGHGDCLAYCDALEATPRDPLPRLEPMPSRVEPIEQSLAQVPVAQGRQARRTPPLQQRCKEQPVVHEPMRLMIFNRDITEPGLAVAHLGGLRCKFSAGRSRAVDRARGTPLKLVTPLGTSRRKPCNDDAVMAILAIVDEQHSEVAEYNWKCAQDAGSYTRHNFLHDAPSRFNHLPHPVCRSRKIRTKSCFRRNGPYMLPPMSNVRE